MGFGPFEIQAFADRNFNTLIEYRYTCKFVVERSVRRELR
jgi:hypothetical protein